MAILNLTKRYLKIVFFTVCYLTFSVFDDIYSEIPKTLIVTTNLKTIVKNIE